MVGSRSGGLPAVGEPGRGSCLWCIRRWMVGSMQGVLRGGFHGLLGGADRGRAVGLGGHFEASSLFSIGSGLFLHLLPPMNRGKQARFPGLGLLALCSDGARDGGGLRGWWKTAMVIQDGEGLWCLLVI